MEHQYQPLRSLAWWGINHWIRRSFPGVAAITPQELVAWQHDPTRPQPLLLDSRGAEEFAVSHLPGALSAPDLAAALALDLPTDRPVVVYCSVGYRSARLAQQLQRQGRWPVFNLQGSLFQWVNHGYPICQQGQPTRAVHPYNWLWGRLLQPGTAQPLTPPSPPPT